MITRSGTELSIVIPAIRSRRMLLALIISPLFLSVLLMDSVSFWLEATSLAEVVLLMGSAWSLSGRTVVTVDKGILAMKRQILGVGLTQRFDISRVANLRMGQEETRVRDVMELVPVVSFDISSEAQFKTLTIAEGDLDWDEAEAVLGSLSQAMAASGPADFVDQSARARMVRSIIGMRK